MPSVYRCVSLNEENERLKTKIKSLKNEILQLKQRQPEQRSCSISISCQTEQLRSVSPKNKDEEIRLRRLVDAQNDLLKRYEEDFRSTSQKFIDDYRRKLRRYDEDKQRAIHRTKKAEHRQEKVQKRFDELREKLSVFDREFFDEINDLKFALQQSIHLNREYEKTIEVLSKQLGIDYPIK